jgi:hypothetical protein
MLGVYLHATFLLVCHPVLQILEGKKMYTTHIQASSTLAEELGAVA